MDTQALVIQLRYSAWATQRILDLTASIPREELFRDLGNSKFNETANAGGLYGTLSHIYQADSIWFDRLIGTPTTDLSVYDPPPEHAALAATWLAVHDRYIAWSESSVWGSVVAYHDTKRNPYTTPVWQIVLHIVNHATYHRGQIITMLKQLGRPVIGTDLIAYYREAARA
jgi:uncharacterized damage-inducible protein DinB